MFFQNATASRLAGDTPCPCAVPGWPGSFPSPPSALPCRALCRAGAAGQRFRQRVPSAVLQALKQSPEGSWEAPGMSRGSFRGPDGDKKRRMLRCELHPPVPTAPLGRGGAQRSAPSAQHPVPSTQRCRAPQSFTLPLPTLTACGLRGSASSKTPGFGPGSAPCAGAWPWRWKLVQHGADRQQHRMVSKEREDETNQESRGVRASSGPGAGDFPPPGEADRLQQQCWWQTPRGRRLHRGTLRADDTTKPHAQRHTHTAVTRNEAKPSALPLPKPPLRTFGEGGRAHTHTGGLAPAHGGGHLFLKSYGVGPSGFAELRAVGLESP